MCRRWRGWVREDQGIPAALVAGAAELLPGHLRAVRMERRLFLSVWTMVLFVLFVAVLSFLRNGEGVSTLGGGAHVANRGSAPAPPGRLRPFACVKDHQSVLSSIPLR